MKLPKIKTSQIVFLPSQFKPTEWSTTKDKADFANHFVRFIESGFQASLFNARFYQRMSTCRGHIAHYNRGGFYSEWFSDDESRAKFIQHWKSAEIYGDPTWTYSDVERVLRSWLLSREERFDGLPTQSTAM